MKKLLIGLCFAGLVGLALALINPAYADSLDTVEAATEVGIPGLVFPHTWTTAITSKARINAMYIKIYTAATPQINIFLDSNKGATYDALLATDYMVYQPDSVGAHYFSWKPEYDLVIEKADEIRVVVGAANLHSATQLGILIKGERL